MVDLAVVDCPLAVVDCPCHLDPLVPSHSDCRQESIRWEGSDPEAHVPVQLNSAVQTSSSIGAMTSFWLQECFRLVLPLLSALPAKCCFVSSSVSEQDGNTHTHYIYIYRPNPKAADRAVGRPVPRWTWKSA